MITSKARTPITRPTIVPTLVFFPEPVLVGGFEGGSDPDELLLQKKIRGATERFGADTNFEDGVKAITEFRVSMAASCPPGAKEPWGRGGPAQYGEYEFASGRLARSMRALYYASHELMRQGYRER